MTTAPILVVDDDAKIVRLVRTYLERAGYRVVEAADGPSALAAITRQQPSLIVLDIMLPEIDGLSVLRALRRTSKTPVIVLSARGTVGDRIEGLEVGADDYLAKPFSPAELVVRVGRVLDRVRDEQAAGGHILRQGDLMVDPERHQVTIAGRPISLTAAEFRLLTALLEADGRVLTRDQLMDAVYGIDELVLDRTIDVHVGRLRDKLGDDASAPRYIATIRGVGYRAAAVPPSPTTPATPARTT